MVNVIPLWAPFIPDETANEVGKVLASGWLNTGEEERLFTKTFQAKFGIPYCVATNSGTSSLKIGLAAAGVGPGDEVVSTPFTFIATNTAILELGATPMFADIQYDTLNIDPASIEAKITAKTKAIVCVHYGGNPCDMDAIREIGRRNGLPVIEDAAHALGSKYREQYIGATADIAAFSLQAIKIVTCGDGGVVTATNEGYYREMKKRVWYGIDRELRSTESLDPLPDRIDVLGFKANLNDIAAAIGLAGLRHIDEALERRRKIGEIYRNELARCSKIKLLRYPRENTPNYQLFPIHVEDRGGFAAHMKTRHIRVGLNNRRNDHYAIFGGMRDLPVTERADKDVVIIPIHASLTDDDVHRVVDAIKDFDRMP